MSPSTTTKARPATAALWRPDHARLAETPMAGFQDFAGARAGRSFADTPALHAWSIAELAAFWDGVWDFFDVVGDKGKDGDRMPGTRFFPDARLNFAESLLAGSAQVPRRASCRRKCSPWPTFPARKPAKSPSPMCAT
jgi:hypothetical protein